MDKFLRPVYERYTKDVNTLGILYVESVRPHSPLTENFDLILLIIIEEADNPWCAAHYEKAGETIEVNIVTKTQLTSWIDTSGYRRAVEWIINGNIIFERNGYVKQLKAQLQNFPRKKRNLRKTIDFGKLLKSFYEAKELYKLGEHKDAYSKIMNALHYLARLTVLEKGFYPEVMVWNQVKNIDIEVYKLFEEFMLSEEELDKKIELMLLAVDFMINNRATSGALHLLEIMETKDEWSYAELKKHPDTKAYALDLSVIVSYLAENNYLDVIRKVSNGDNLFELTYKARNDSPF